MRRPTIVLIALSLTTSGAWAATNPLTVTPDPSPRTAPAEIQVAANKVYMLVNPLPFPVQVKIHGNGPGFPSVVTMPIGGIPVPIPYPDISMQIQIKKPSGGWSPKFIVPWKAGPITLPGV